MEDQICPVDGAVVPVAQVRDIGAGEGLGVHADVGHCAVQGIKARPPKAGDRIADRERGGYVDPAGSACGGCQDAVDVDVRGVAGVVYDEGNVHPLPRGNG